MIISFFASSQQSTEIWLPSLFASLIGNYIKKQNMYVLILDLKW